ncbi:MAG: cobalamin-dependent protein [Thermoanaerobaculia bacterium]
MASVRLINLSSLPIVGNQPIYPVGVVSVAAALRADGHGVEIVDFVERPERAADLTWLDEPCDVIGFAIRDVDPIDIARFSFVGSFASFAAQVKMRTEGSGYRPLFVGGGTGVTLFPRELGARLGLDAVVSGEGERALADLCRALKPMRAPGLSLLSTPDEEFPRRLFDHPASLVKAYLRAKRSEIGVETRRRKCLRRCQYCPYAFINDGALGEFREIGPLRRTIEQLYSLGVRHLFFTDAVFNNELVMAKRVCRLLVEIGYPDLQWSAYFVPSGFDQELAELMAASGNHTVIFSPDSFDPRMLRQSGKGYSLKHVFQAKEICDAVGLSSAWVLLFGSAHEDRNTIRCSAQVANELFDDQEISINVGIRLLPGSPLVKQLQLQAEDLLQPVFYPIDPRVFDWILEDFEGRFFKRERMLRFLAMQTSLKNLTRRQFANPLDASLDCLLIQERQGGLPAAPAFS